MSLLEEDGRVQSVDEILSSLQKLTLEEEEKERRDIHSKNCQNLHSNSASSDTGLSVGRFVQRDEWGISRHGFLRLTLGKSPDFAWDPQCEVVDGPSPMLLDRVKRGDQANPKYLHSSFFKEQHAGDKLKSQLTQERINSLRTLDVQQWALPLLNIAKKSLAADADAPDLVISSRGTLRRLVEMSALLEDSRLKPGSTLQISVRRVEETEEFPAHLIVVHGTPRLVQYLQNPKYVNAIAWSIPVLLTEKPETSDPNEVMQMVTMEKRDSKNGRLLRRWAMVAEIDGSVKTQEKILTVEVKTMVGEKFLLPNMRSALWQSLLGGVDWVWAFVHDKNKITNIITVPVPLPILDTGILKKQKKMPSPCRHAVKYVQDQTESLLGIVQTFFNDISLNIQKSPDSKAIYHLVVQMVDGSLQCSPTDFSNPKTELLTIIE